MGYTSGMQTWKDGLHADLGNNWCWGKLCRFIYIYMIYIYRCFFSNDDLNLVRTVRGKHTHIYI